MPLSGVLDNSQVVGLVGQNQPGLSKVSVLKQTKGFETRRRRERRGDARTNTLRPQRL